MIQVEYPLKVFDKNQGKFWFIFMAYLLHYIILLSHTCMLGGFQVMKIPTKYVPIKTKIDVNWLKSFCWDSLCNGVFMGGTRFLPVYITLNINTITMQFF